MFLLLHPNRRHLAGNPLLTKQKVEVDRLPEREDLEKVLQLDRGRIFNTTLWWELGRWYGYTAIPHLVATNSLVELETCCEAMAANRTT